MKIAIVGSGIAGNVVAYHLRDKHDITVYESNNHIGGHTNTVDVQDAGRTIPVDTGFIVFNDRTYPNFIELLERLGQPAQKSVMSFSVRNDRSGVEYNGSSLGGLFAQRKNLANLGFLRMIGDILRFNNEASALLESASAEMTIAEFLDHGRYSKRFAADYLVPMIAAIWSAKPERVADMPLRFLLRFFLNHGLLSIRNRPTWFVIKGGSREYVRKLTAGHRDQIRLGCAVERIFRERQGVAIKAKGAELEHFDYVFLACHSDQALALLDRPTPLEQSVLGAIRYQKNDAVLHTDERMLPASRHAWAAWNYRVPADSRERVSVTYNMNILQSLDSTRQYCVTLNDIDSIDPDRVIYQTVYEHPIYTNAVIDAQRRHQAVNTGNRTSYCGAYWRNGFHEDGVVSALEALRHFEEEQRGELRLRRAS